VSGAQVRYSIVLAPNASDVLFANVEMIVQGTALRAPTMSAGRARYVASAPRLGIFCHSRIR
jgi:hypothetical protein